MMNRLASFTVLICLLALVLVPAISCADPLIQHNKQLAKQFGYYGQMTMEEQITQADVVVRASLESVTTGTERWDDSEHLPPEPGDRYVGTLEHTFSIHEYIKGTGDDEVVALVVAMESYGHETVAGAADAATNLLNRRDAQWDGREAILFLTTNHDYMVDLPRAGYYLLGADPWGRGMVQEPDEPFYRDRYSIASIYEKAWLPAASGALGASSRRSNTSQHFLLDVPSSGNARGSRSDSSAGQSSTIALADLKTKVNGIEQEIAEAVDSQIYRDCLYYKYSSARIVRHQTERRGGVYGSARYDAAIDSGLPAGSRAFINPAGGRVLEEFGDAEEAPPDFGEFAFTGRDADLFIGEYPGFANIARPLPAGEYWFYYDIKWPSVEVCDGMPDEWKTVHQVFITVTAPKGTLHEALFDPQTLSSGDGYMGSTGELSPATFNVGSTAHTIASLYGTGDAVTMALSPYLDLTAHTFDFITGDGTTMLSLTDATGDATAGTLMWAVDGQPWSSGDELMLRITEPWFGVRVALSPRQGERQTYTDITISWTDPQTCGSQYFVGLYQGDTVVRTLGYPDATTTSISNSTGMQSDSIPSLTSTARVNCIDNNWRLVGDVSLTSGLP